MLRSWFQSRCGLTRVYGKGSDCFIRCRKCDFLRAYRPGGGESTGGGIWWRPSLILTSWHNYAMEAQMTTRLASAGGQSDKKVKLSEFTLCLLEDLPLDLCFLSNLVLVFEIL